MLNIAVIVPGLYLLQPKRLWRYMRKARTLTTPRQRFRRAYRRSLMYLWLTGRTAASLIQPFVGIAALSHRRLLRLFALVPLPLARYTYLGLDLPEFGSESIHGRSRIGRTRWLQRGINRLVDHTPVRMGIGYTACLAWVDSP